MEVLKNAYGIDGPASAPTTILGIHRVNRLDPVEKVWAAKEDYKCKSYSPLKINNKNLNQGD